MKVVFAAALTDREFECAGLGLYSSPPVSTRVLRPGRFAGGGGIDDERALLADADISRSFCIEGIRLGGPGWGN